MADEPRADDQVVLEMAPGARADAARAAAAKGDAEESKRLHDATKVEAAKEVHGGVGADFIKSITFGGLDGIITTFAIVAAVQGAALSTKVIIMMGFSNLVADAISMGVGDYLSSKAEMEYVLSERAREAWEYDNYREGEITEMVELYEEAGFKKDDAETILRTMAKEEYRDFFIDHMMVVELGKMTPDEDENPAKDGFVTFCSFLLFGSVPMWFYVVFELADWQDNGAMFAIACVATAFTMFLLGATKARITKMPWVKSGMYMMFNGVLAAGAAYLVGWALEELLDVGENCAA